MELKYAILLQGKIPQGSFNRTFMELKLFTGLLALRAATVLIVPLWN